MYIDQCPSAGMSSCVMLSIRMHGHSSAVEKLFFGEIQTADACYLGSLASKTLT